MGGVELDRAQNFIALLTHSLIDAQRAGCNGRLPTWHGRERNGPFVWARRSTPGLPASGLTISTASLNLLRVVASNVGLFFSFLRLFLLACVFGGTRASFLLIPRVSTDAHNVPVRPRRKSDHLQDNCHTNFLPARRMEFSWSPQPSTDCAARTSTDF